MIPAGRCPADSEQTGQEPVLVDGQHPLRRERAWLKGEADDSGQ